LAQKLIGAERCELATISSILTGSRNAGSPIPDVTFLCRFCAEGVILRATKPKLSTLEDVCVR
jgi:hypothetical protein